MKKIVSLVLFFCWGMWTAQAQTLTDEFARANEAVLPSYDKFEYEFVNKVVIPEKPRVDLRLGKKSAKNTTVKKSWLARNFGIRKVDVAWRNVRPTL